MPNTFDVKPIYGWGWVQDGQGRLEPAPFSVALGSQEPGCWAGVIEGAGHEFEGRRIALSQRHQRWDGFVNICIGPDEPRLQRIYGYGQLPGFDRLAGAG